MLTLTENATVALRTILATSNLPADGGVRVAANDDTPGEPGFQLTLVEHPTPGDHLAESDPPVFVDAAAVPLLDARVLDAEAVDGAVSFLIVPRAA